MSNNRLEYFDVLKGVAIIMVVGIHTMPHIDGYFASFGNAFASLLRMAMNCAVPLFLAISGWMLANKPVGSKQEILDFYKKRLPRVYIPLLVWGSGWLILSLLKTPTSDNALFGIIYLLTGGFSVYYFVALIMQCYLITPLLSRYYKSGG